SPPASIRSAPRRAAQNLPAPSGSHPAGWAPPLPSESQPVPPAASITPVSDSVRCINLADSIPLSLSGLSPPNEIRSAHAEPPRRLRREPRRERLRPLS